MSDITINYKGSAIATMDASGTTSLLTEGKFCEDDIDVVYVKPGGGELGEFTLLNTINASEAVSSVSLTIPSGYTEIAISYSVEMSASSRLYFYFNSVASSRLLDQSGSGTEKSGMFVIQRLEAVTLDNFTASEKTVAHTSSDQASAPIAFAYPPSSIECVPSTQGVTLTGSFKIYGR